MATHRRPKHRPHVSRFALAASISALVLIGLAVMRSVPRPGRPVAGRVVRVHDGDTITIASRGMQFRCRLLGIDAPEMSYSGLSEEMDKVSKYAPEEGREELSAAKESFRKWIGAMEAQARLAWEGLHEMVGGKRVRLAYDSNEPEEDRYGRLLVYVSVDGTDVSAEMIKRGLALADTRFGCDRLEEYVILCRDAQTAQVGLWATEGKPAQE